MLLVTRIAAMLWAVATLVALAPLATADDAKSNPADNDPSGVEFFEQHIRPLLVAHCYECHSAGSKELQGGLRLDDRQAMRAGGDSGPAVVPGKAGDSLLMQAVEYEGKLYDMPPGGKLPAKAIAEFRRWIDMGAPDPREAKAAASIPDKPTAATAKKSLWVLSPLRRPATPEVREHRDANGQSWAQGAVDRFILAALQQRGLNPAAQADRYTLLRRVTYDLTGLPPTPDEIKSFVEDVSPLAWEHVVDRLLASPAFGDHWARHWFDLSCYADLSDVTGNVVIQGAWRYRDYVIDAFNRDKPLDRFITEQIAGDLLPYENLAQRREQLIATGFLSIGPWTLQNYVKPQLQADVVDHQVDKVSRTFLGMSVRCARCHDHKFDPIPTRDYYALAGIFQSTLTTRYDGPGVWSQIVSRELPSSPDDRAAAEYERTTQDLKRQQAAIETELAQSRRKSSPVKFTEKLVAGSANALTLTTPIAANDAGSIYSVAFSAGPSVWQGVQQATGAKDGILVQVLRKDGSVLAYHEHLPGEWSGKADSQTLRAVSFSYGGDGSGPITLHITASNPSSVRFAGAIDDLAIARTDNGAVLFREDFEAYQTRGTPGKQVHTLLPVFAGGTIPNWTGSGVNHSHAVDLGGAAGPRNIAIQFFSGDAGAATPQEAKLQGKLGEIAARLQLLDYARPSRTRVLAVQDIPRPHDFPIYVRGNFRTPGAVAPRGALSAMHGEPFPAIPSGESGRKELAQWLTDPGNVATPRVLANRVWQHLFGAGIVRTVDYFGAYGEDPSHPELLDYLAIRLRDDRSWSLKSLVRELVLSNTYRMSSAHDARSSQVDHDNRYLWRMNRRRLTAESIRDGLMATSGMLDNGRGGDSLGLEIPGNVGGIGDTVNLPTYSRAHVPEQIARRRSVYLPLLRAPPDGPLEILSVFDFPHPSEITGQRPERTVATQALFLLNAPLVKEQAARTASNLLAQPSAGAKDRDGDEEAARINRLYLLVLNRSADAAEQRDAIEFLAQFQQASAVSSAAPADRRRAAWDEFCHALYASNDFLFLE